MDRSEFVLRLSDSKESTKRLSILAVVGGKASNPGIDPANVEKAPPTAPPQGTLHVELHQLRWQEAFRMSRSYFDVDDRQALTVGSVGIECASMDELRLRRLTACQISPGIKCLLAMMQG